MTDKKKEVPILSIHKACQKGNYDAVVAQLKKKKNNVNLEDETGHTPIQLAALHGSFEVVQLLVENGADLNQQDPSGWCALHFAASGRNEKLFAYLLSQESINVNLRNEGLNTPLHYLAKNFANLSEQILHDLIQKGADINAQNAQGETPLHGAALKGYEQVTTSLIDYGADVDICNNEGETPLNWATRNGHVKVISVLLKAYSNKNKSRSASLKPSIDQAVREGSNLLREQKKQQRHTLNVTSDFDQPLQERYELTFFGENFHLSLHDDNWDKCLYEGGLTLEQSSEKSSKESSKSSNIETPLRKEELPLSKLFHMYLTISGKNKTDPEILHWIAKFLTGPKKTYLVYLMNNYGYRIRLRNPQNKDSGSSTPQPSQPKSIGRSVSLQNLKSDKNAANPIDSSSNSLSTESATGAADPPHNDNNSDAHHSANSLDDSKSNSSSNRNSYDLGQTAPLESWDEEPVPHRPSPVVSPFESPAYMNKLKAFNAKKAKFDIWNEPSPRDRELYQLYFDVNEKKTTEVKPIPFQTTTEPGGRDRSYSLLEHRKLSKFHWEIDPHDLQVTDKIGRGSFGVVYKAVWMGVEVAVKKVECDDMSAEDYQNFLYEISMMSNLRHPNVLTFLGGSLEPPNLCFVTEYAQRGSLHQVLKTTQLTWMQRLNMSLDAAKGLMYLHHQVPPIVHRDLKSLNLLVDETFKIKVADFGLSKDKNNDINTKMGTLNWVAPEILNDNSQPYTEKADLYSFGLVLWEILTNKTPYEGKTTLQIVRLIDMGERPKVPTDADPEFAKLIVDCWHSDPAKRPPIEAVFKRLQAIKARYDKAAQPSSTKQ
jgi:hypothetical protein